MGLPSVYWAEHINLSLILQIYILKSQAQQCVYVPRSAGEVETLDP